MSDEFKNIELHDLKELKARLTNTPHQVGGSQAIEFEEDDPSSPPNVPETDSPLLPSSLDPVRKVSDLGDIKVGDDSRIFEIIAAIILISLVVFLLLDKPKEEKYSKGIKNVMEEVKKRGENSLSVESRLKKAENSLPPKDLLKETKRLLNPTESDKGLSNGLDK